MEENMTGSHRRLLFLFGVFLIIFVNNDVSADQICQAFDAGTCPAETCCKQSKCDEENLGFKCCSTPGSDCSNCPTCRK